jgi:hypothetical protein
VNRFQDPIKIRKDIVRDDVLLGGVWIFITNHPEKRGRENQIKPETIIQAYWNKNKSEDIFGNVKSFLKLRPFFVNITLFYELFSFQINQFHFRG